MIKIIIINLLIITSSLAMDDVIEVEVKEYFRKYDLNRAEEKFSEIEDQVFQCLFHPLLCTENELLTLYPANDQEKLINAFVNTELFAAILGKREKEVVQSEFDINNHSSFLKENNNSLLSNAISNKENSFDNIKSLKESIQNSYEKFEELFLEKREDLLEDEILRIGVTSRGGRHVISTLYVLFYTRECFYDNMVLDSESFYKTFKEFFNEKGIDLEQENAPLKSKKIQNYLEANVQKKFIKYNDFFSNKGALPIEIEKERLIFSPSKNNSSFVEGESFMDQYSGFLETSPSKKSKTSLKKNKRKIDPKTASFN